MIKYIWTIVFLLFFLQSAISQLVDDNTPKDVIPYLVNPINNSWELVFTDEFETDEISSNKWNINVSTKSRAPRPGLGINDWWWKKENVSQELGKLVLKVEKHDANTMYCGSVNSNNLYETKYGYFEVRLKIAEAAKGTHTAFWFQGDNMSNVDDTANDGAEIDVFESAWLGDYTKSVVHIDGYGKDHHANTKRYDTPGIHKGYHIWGLHWTEDFMKIYYDGKLKVTYSSSQWVVKSPEFLWLSNGASFGFSGDYFKQEPIGTLTHAYIDYVRVWKPSKATFIGVNEQNSKMLIYPNPVKDRLHVNALKLGKCMVYNLNGQLVSTTIEKDCINVAGLKGGCYFLKTDRNHILKFLKE